MLSLNATKSFHNPNTQQTNLFYLFKLPRCHLFIFTTRLGRLHFYFIFFINFHSAFCFCFFCMQKKRDSFETKRRAWFFVSIKLMPFDRLQLENNSSSCIANNCSDKMLWFDALRRYGFVKWFSSMPHTNHSTNHVHCKIPFLIIPQHVAPPCDSLIDRYVLQNGKTIFTIFNSNHIYHVWPHRRTIYRLTVSIVCILINLWTKDCEILADCLQPIPVNQWLSRLPIDYFSPNQIKHMQRNENSAHKINSSTQKFNLLRCELFITKRFPCISLKIGFKSSIAH